MNGADSCPSWSPARPGHATKGPSDTAWHDDTGDMVAVLKRHIAMIKAIEEQYRP